MSGQKPLGSILIKPAGPDCNLACAYCFYLQKSELFAGKVHRMSEETLQELVMQVMQGGGQQVSFGWQGGEPTLMGLEFYQKAVEYQKKYGRAGQMVGNGLQTNGILINAEWARFLKDAQFLVGLSLDGPKHIHDKYRQYPGGKSTWQRVAQARDILLENGAEVNALVVVNDYSVQFPQEIYEYHKANGLTHQQYIPCVEPDPANPGSAMLYTVSPQDFGDFLCTMFDLWMADFKSGRPTTSVRWFDSLFYTYVGYDAPECTLLPECGIYVVAEHNGDIYSCDFFVDPAWKLGNIKDDNIAQLLNSPLQNMFGKVKAKMPAECEGCKWLKHCYGGCPKDRMGNPASNGSNHFCQSYKMFFEHADDRLQQMADQWMIERGIKQPEKTGTIRNQGEEVRRNQPCPCGSGKKYKNCCGRK